MNKKKELMAIIMLISICCAIMAVVDGFIQPDYAVKSAIKIVLFLICPMIYSLVHKDINLLSWLCFFNTKKIDYKKICLYI